MASSSGFMPLLVLFALQICALLIIVSSQSPPPPPPPVCHTSHDCPPGQNCRFDSTLGVRVCRTRTGCFPGDALVHLHTGGLKPMKDLSIGDKVAVGKGADGMIFSDIYAFGRKDSDVVTEFLQIRMKSGDNHSTLELTASHFIPSGEEGKMVQKRAQNLKVGDTVWSTHDGSASLLPYTITEINQVDKLGLFKPLTLTGNILVNDVLVSVHSDSFLDSLFQAIGATHCLPSAYQLLLAPARGAYKILGAEIYSKGYSILGAYLNAAEYGGVITAAVVTAVIAGLSTTKN